MNLRADSIDSHPKFPWLKAGDRAAIREFLESRGWLQGGESVLQCTKAGEGNMNLTLRITTSTRTFILKQARPWVEKYDHIPAPWDRILYEQGFYERVRSIPPVAIRMPKILASDAASRAFIMEDLPDARDFTDIYAGAPLAANELGDLAEFLSALHQATRGVPDPEFENREMRALNHQHIFVVPLDPSNGLELERHEKGLTTMAARLQFDRPYKDRIEELSAWYLADGPCLLHGDYFPGSWLRTPNGIRVIDPEFCYYGDPEFDLGVCVAHLCLAKRNAAEAAIFLEAYSGNFDWALTARYASVEIMRRLIGVAQLPIPPTTGFRVPLLDRSRRALLSGDIWELWR